MITRTAPLASRWLFLISFALMLLASARAQSPFAHPGGLHTQSDLDRMKARVAAGESPWIESWNALLQNPKAQSTYNPAPNANMGTSRQRASADAVAAYFNALRGYIADSPAHTDNAIRICNLWSAAVDQVPSGFDQPGLSGLYCYQFAVVGEMLRIHVGTRWAQADFDRFKAMVRNYLYPVVNDFLVRHNNACISHYWTNWDAANIAALAAMGVLLDDEAIFNEGIEYFKHGAGNGSIQHAVHVVHPGGPGQPYGLGQWQESGRDQEHNILGVGLLGTFCQIAWNQGVDMYAYDNYRMLAGAEYVAQYAIGQDVPYAFYDNCDDVNQFWPASHDRGRLQRPIWEMLYNHYVVRLGLSAPSLTAIAALNRPEGFSHDDHFGYGTLAYTLDAAASGYPTAAPGIPLSLTATDGAGRVSLSWDPVPTANGYVVRRATISGGPYTTIATYRGANARYTDTSVTNGVTYFYRVAAENQTGTGGDSDEASATPLAASVTLPDGWAHRDIGVVAEAGGATYSSAGNDTFFVSGAGAGIGGMADGGGFAFATVNGDTSITARRIGANGAAGVNGRIGVMIRESLAPDAKTQTLFVGDLGFREARFGTRSTIGGQMSFITGNGYSGGAWFRLVRSGDTFSAYQSGDGVTWHFVGSSVVAMPATVHVGIAAGSGRENLLRGDFDEVSLEGAILPGPPANLVALNGHGQVSLSWSASVGATSYDLKRATTSGGPYTVIATGLTSTEYVDTGLTDGVAYYYVLTARQEAYVSVSSGETVGVPGDINTIWGSSPASGNWSTPANWLGSSVPENGSSLVFGATTVATLNNDLGGLAINRLKFNPGAPAYTISGNTLTAGGDIANDSGSLQTLALDLALAGIPIVEARNGPIALRGVVSDGGTPGGFVKAGTQALFVSGLNTFSGDVRIEAGAVSIAGPGTGTAGSPVAGALGRGTVRLAGGTLTSSAAARIYNTVVVEPGTTSAIASSSANITFAGNISGSGNITESGANTGGTHFNGDNSGFTGTFSSSNATGHRIRFNNPAAGSANATWIMSNGQGDGNGFAFPAGSGTIAFGALSGGGQFRNNAIGTATMRIGDLNTDTTFTGIFVSNSTRIIAVEKVGTGRLTFTGGHTYDGPTHVRGGTLIVNGALRNSVTVHAGATFGGTGDVTAAINVNSGGAFAPGNLGIGTSTTTAGLTYQAGAVHRLELNSDTGAADKVVASSVNLAGALLQTTDLGNASLPAGTSITIIDNTGAASVSGTFSGLPEGALFALGANQFRISYAGGTGNDVVLTVVVPVEIALSGFEQLYDGSAKPVSVVTTPADIAVAISYNGSQDAPTDAGTYAVEVTPIDSAYLGSATGTLTIAKAPAVVSLGSLAPTFDGDPKAVGVSTSPAGLPVKVTYNGAVFPPTNAGTYTVTATVDHPNYAGSVSGSLVIAKATATIALAPLSQNYTGAPREVEAITTPADLTVNLTYNGSHNVPIYPGEYAVTATIDDPNYEGTASDTLAVSITALVRHAPTLNGILDGSVQLLLPESVTLNGSSSISGDLLLPGTPSVRTNAQPVFAGTLDGPGAATPTAHRVTLNGAAVLAYLVRRIDAIEMPVVSAPSGPTGTRSVTLNSAPTTPVAFTTVRNLTIQGSAGRIAVPPGAYGEFSANGNTGFILGVAGATEPAIYDLQGLTLHGSATLDIAGPVVLTLGRGVIFIGVAGNADHPDWLALRVHQGGITLNQPARVHAFATAPAGTITVNGGAELRGRLAADRLVLNTQSLFEDPHP